MERHLTESQELKCSQNIEDLQKVPVLLETTSLGDLSPLGPGTTLPLLHPLPLFASAKSMNETDEMHVRKHIAQVTLNCQRPFKINSEGGIDLDWLALPPKNFASAIRDGMLTIIRQIGCNGKQPADAHNHFLPCPDGFIEPTITFWREEPNESKDDSPREEIRRALVHYVSAIFEDIVLPETESNSTLSSTHTTAGVALANSLAKSLLRQFPGNSSPVELRIMVYDQVFPRCSRLRATKVTDIEPSTDLPLLCKVTNWKAEKTHVITVKSVGDNKSMKIEYDRDDEKCDWRILRNGLDEPTTYSIVVAYQIVNGTETYTLQSAAVGADLLDKT